MDAKLDCSGNRGTHCPAGGRISGDGLRGDVNYAPVGGGISPALASASVHIAEMGTCAMSGASHWRFGNVDWSKIVWLAVPGAIGAFLGAVVLASVITAEAA